MYFDHNLLQVLPLTPRSSFTSLLKIKFGSSHIFSMNEITSMNTKYFSMYHSTGKAIGSQDSTFDYHHVFFCRFWTPAIITWKIRIVCWRSTGIRMRDQTLFPRAWAAHKCFRLQNDVCTKLFLECMPNPKCFQHSLKVERSCFSTQCHLLFICDIARWYIKQIREINQLKQLQNAQIINIYYLSKVFCDRFHSFICIVFTK